nr:immunoglobulin heavy chain junction region [Macaca mulatta]MOX95959.1 immunoglobulin heavy chain junction region [Macaca mulatta]
CVNSGIAATGPDYW